MSRYSYCKHRGRVPNVRSADQVNPRTSQSQTQSMQPSRQIGPTTPGVPRQDGRSCLSAFGIFRIALVQHRYLTVTLRFDHDRQIQATKESRHCYPLTGCRHRSGEHRKGSVEYDPCSSCFWRRHYPSRYNQGKSMIPLCERDVPGSKIVRTRWLTTRIVWTSGYSVPMSAMRLDGERAERGHAISASRCPVR